MGGHSIQQNVRGHPVIFYRFPTQLSVAEGAAVTVWAQQSPASRRHNHHHQQQQQQQPKSIEIVYKGVEKWMSDTHCTTVLCRPTGQVRHIVSLVR